MESQTISCHIPPLHFKTTSCTIVLFIEVIFFSIVHVAAPKCKNRINDNKYIQKKVQMIRKFSLNPHGRKLLFVVAVSLLHYGAIIRTHVMYFHQNTQIPDNNNMHDGVMDKASYRSLRSSLEANTSVLTNKRVPRELPMFNETGGIIVFIHIAKTGGSSIREGFRKLPNINVKRIMNEAQLSGKRDKIDWYLSSNNSKSTKNGGKEKVLLLEIHGHHGEPMAMSQVHPYIQNWKAQAVKNKKNIFVFTLFREPAAFHLSYFTFFRHPNCQELWCDRPVLPQTEEHLIQSMVPNHQCLYLARKFNKITTDDSMVVTPVTELECESVQTLLLQDVDWIGTTDSLSKTTIPLLTFIVAGNASIAKDFLVANRQNVKKKLQLHDISINAIQQIRQQSGLDEHLYEMAHRHYTLGMWNNFANS